MNTLVVFAHGKESGPWGTKFRYLAELAQRYGASVLSPDYSDCSGPEERVERLLALAMPSHERLILVGSSMGAYVSTVASVHLKPMGLFLLAPAFYLPGYREQTPLPCAPHISVVHGWQDTVIDPEHSVRFARQYGCDLHLIPGDHRLTEALPKIGAIFADFLGKQLGLQCADY